MRTLVAVLTSLSAAFFLFGTTARAQNTVVPDPNGVTLEVGVSQGRLDPNYGIDLAPEKTVARAAVTFTHDHFSGMLRNYTVVSTDSHQGLGDEQQIEGCYHTADVTRLGTFAYKACATYRALNMGHGSGTSDDYLEAMGQLAYPLKIAGSFDFAPYVRVVKEIPVGHNNPLFWGMGGVLFCGPVLSDARFCVDAVSVHNVNSETAVPHKNTWSVEANVKRPIWFGIIGMLGVSYTEYSERDTRYEYRPRADGRLDPFTRADKDRTRPGAKFSVGVSKSF
jgi:hypothetical protein